MRLSLLPHKSHCLKYSISYQWPAGRVHLSFSYSCSFSAFVQQLYSPPSLLRSEQWWSWDPSSSIVVSCYFLPIWKIILNFLVETRSSRGLNFRAAPTPTPTPAPPMKGKNKRKLRISFGLKKSATCFEVYNKVKIIFWMPLLHRSPRSKSSEVGKLHKHSCLDLKKIFYPGDTYLSQCCGSASIIMRIRIQDPKNVHMDPDADPRG